MATEIGKAIGDMINGVIIFIIFMIIATFVSTRWYYNEEITVGNLAYDKIANCESHIKRDEHCMLIVEAVLVD